MKVKLSEYWAMQDLDANIHDDVQSFWDVCLQRQDDSRITITPRRCDNYISFRYCGLEVLQVPRTPEASWVAPSFFDSSENIRRSNKAKYGVSTTRPPPRKTTQSVKEYVQSMVAILYQELIKRILDDPEAFKARQSIVPGFGFEHWLESLVLADTSGGKRVRQKLGLPVDLDKVVTQVPVILDDSEKNDDTKHKVLHIDVAGIENGLFTIVELKVDDEIETASAELQDYLAWALQNPALMTRQAYRNRNFSKEKRGSPREMFEAKFLPADPTGAAIRLVGVVDSQDNLLPVNIHDAPLSWVKLAPGKRAWLLDASGYPFES